MADPTAVKTGAVSRDERARTARRLDLLGVLERAVKTVLLYPPSSPQPGEFRARLHARLTGYLEQEGAFIVQSRAGALVSGDAVLRGEAGGEESLAGTLARDGVRRVAFLPGLTDGDLAAFLEAVRAAVTGRGAGEDLAAALWLAAPKTVRWETIGELDDSAVENLEAGLRSGAGRGFGAGAGADFAAVVRAEGGGIPAGAGAGRAEKEEGGAAPASADPAAGRGAPGEPVPLEAARILGALADLSGEGEALAACRREAEAFDPEAAVGGILLELVSLEDEPEGFAESCGLADDYYDRFVERGRFAAALRLRRGLAAREAESRAASAFDRADRLDEILLRGAQAQGTARLTGALDAAGADLEAGTLLLADLPDACVPGLVDALGRLDRYPARKLVCDALAEKGARRVDDLAPGLSDKRWFVVRNTALVLGRIGGERACALLETAARHGEEAVRREAVTALARLAGPESSRILRAVLADPAPLLRLKAVRALAERADAESREAIAARVLAPAFRRLPEPEQAEWLSALARAGGDAALPAFRTLVEPRFLRDWGARRLLALRAVAALGDASGPATRAWLEELLRGRDALRRDEAERALARRRAREGGAP